MFHIRFAIEHRHDLLDVRVQQHVVVGFFLEQGAGVDELGGGVGFVFGEHKDIDGDGGAVKQIGRKGDHGFNIVVVHQILADLLLGTDPVKDAGKADDGGAALAGEITERVQHKGKVGLGFGGEHTGGGKAVVVDQGGIVAADPLHRVRWIGDDGIKGFVVAKMRFDQGVAELDVELVVVDVVQEHVHPRQVVGGVVDLLPKEAFFNDVRVKMLFCLQQQRAGAAGRVVNLVDAGLLVHGELGNQPGHMLRSEELAAGFAGVGGVVGDQELVGVAEQVDLAAVKIAEIQPGHAFEHSSQTQIFILYCVAQAVAGGVKIGKQPLDVPLRGVAAGRGLDGAEGGGQVGIQALVAMGAFGDIDEQLAGVDKVALGLDGVVLDFGRDHAVGQLGIVDAVVTGFNIEGEVFADKAVKQGAQHVLLEIPAVYRAAYIVGNGPDLALQGGALLGACHSVFLFK